eukprot:2134461-Prymnesium_polylepis.1
MRADPAGVMSRVLVCIDLRAGGGGSTPYLRASRCDDRCGPGTRTWDLGRGCDCDVPTGLAQKFRQPDSYCTLMCSPASGGDVLTTPEHQFWGISDVWPPTCLIRQLWGSDEITGDQFISKTRKSEHKATRAVASASNVSLTTDTTSLTPVQS